VRTDVSPDLRWTARIFDSPCIYNSAREPSETSREARKRPGLRDTDCAWPEHFCLIGPPDPEGLDPVTADPVGTAQDTPALVAVAAIVAVAADQIVVVRATVDPDTFRLQDSLCSPGDCNWGCTKCQSRKVLSMIGRSPFDLNTGLRCRKVACADEIARRTGETP